MTLRPVGHITAHIRELNKWRERRLAKALNVNALNTSIAYLVEYRELTLEFATLQNETNKKR